MNKHEAFKQAYDDYPSQDNEGFIPDRAGFKSGFFAAWEMQQARISELEAKLAAAKKDAKWQYERFVKLETTQAFCCMEGEKNIKIAVEALEHFENEYVLIPTGMTCERRYYAREALAKIRGEK